MQLAIIIKFEDTSIFTLRHLHYLQQGILLKTMILQNTKVNNKIRCKIKMRTSTIGTHMHTVTIKQIHNFIKLTDLLHVHTT